MELLFDADNNLYLGFEFASFVPQTQLGFVLEPINKMINIIERLIPWCKAKIVTNKKPSG